MGDGERRDTHRAHRIDIPAEGYESWVDIDVHVQRYGERLTLVKVGWTARTRSGARDLRGPDGEAYWVPGSEFLGRMTRGHVYARHGAAFNSYGDDFETDEPWTAGDLLNLAAASWDGMYWPHLAHMEAGEPGDTNPFRPYVHGYLTGEALREAAADADDSMLGYAV